MRRKTEYFDKLSVNAGTQAPVFTDRSFMWWPCPRVQGHRTKKRGEKRGIKREKRRKKAKRGGKERNERERRGMSRAMVIFGRLKDPRQEKKVMHKLLDIVMITIVAVMCGCGDWGEISIFALARKEVLGQYLELGNGVPSHDTLSRVMGMVDPEALEECYRQWVSEILGNEKQGGEKRDNLSIDGKTIRGSGKPGLKPIHMVSAWSARAGITLAQLKTAEKSNEITAIPDLLEVLDIAGSIVTTDAMGCQTDIAEQIIRQGGEYVLACKENQEGLYKEIEEYFEYADAEAKQEDKDEIGYNQEIHEEKNLGRLEKRTYELIEDCKLLSRFHDFEGAKSIGRVSSRVILRDGNVRSDTRYFIASLSGKQAIGQFAKAVRSHWGIENSCHWVLDVTFGEDACRTRDRIVARNLSLARKLALALAKRVPDKVVERYSHNQAKYTSLKKRLFLAGLYPDFMIEILLAGA